MRLIITQHARAQMFKRGIDEEQIKVAIMRGAKFKQTQGYLAVYTYIRITYLNLGEDTYKIKTVMVD